ncbi:oligoendopeptidase F [Streptococcus equi]|uniref:oligoendopeptidase F n=1 Tax=Streptococcus equi TaxID=1336 RepID=UPI0024A92073|nr:oligoendopeptidase F [Streptococcus equi]MDI5991160.1 oligoendopeptidase F [Streptococcus equi subsp. zooepidemicus]HEL0697724.1 oligoendopeptidase F [Streptococcus equi subsp. zooepidemicus]HEL0807440.1 oligoendopeptidase F [Streptococcus equi subsp. zooepidemicus]HEL1073610.1 oligoendopeptidase F [Streptococcus equi subsp. zooepidemicus]HEL1115781.1 oligoendopeptidase F [Streptococcus equi subsp. zooepidemicus]
MTDNRSHLEEKYTWDLSTIFATDAAWETEADSLLAAIEAARQQAGHLLDSSSSLLDITELHLELARRVEKLYVYASMKNDQDTTVAKYQEYQAKASGIYAKFSEVFSFYEPEFMALTQETYQAFLAEKPELAVYDHFFDKLFKAREHVLSQAEEELLAGAQEIFNGAEETFSILDNADIAFPIVTNDKGEEVELTHGNFISLMESKDRKVRRVAYEAMYSTYEQFQHTYAKTLQTNVKVQNYKARVHKYASARQAAMSANFIPEAVYDTLLETVNKHLPLLHRYLKLRQEVLGLDDIKMYDVYTPLSETDLAIGYDEALEKAEKVLAVFGQDYSERVHRAFTERWIDVHVNKGKRSGAYSGGSYDTNAFMLLNWQDTLDNLYTLVHETGHSLHSTFTRETQPYVYGDYSIFLAEIASTTNENIMTEALLNEVEDDKERFAILNHYLDGFRGTVFRQTQFAEFEHAIHQADQNGEVLTSEYLNNLYADLNEKYYGLKKEDNHFIQYEWARIPHFYYNYYVYQYATGFAAASYLADKIVHGTQEDIDHYLTYLKSGNSDYPLEVIAKAGVDMGKGDYLEAAFKVFEERLTELEDLVARGAHL